MAEPARPDVRYTAFLSYSHKDAAAAGRLHRRLEAYRMPRRLAGSQGTRGPVPERLWPIFRDREELPAATDLSDTVRAALGQSGALIILCSPCAAGSLWVAEEIEVFRTLHPDRPILAAILDGDPPDCFPAALRAFGRDGTWHEPLATDLRRGKDGKQLGLLKLVAGITGVGLDALVQRDASRRVRRITILSTLALVGLLLMTGMALVALNARKEAERQRVEAEGLVEFMLTDLRQELRGVGRLAVMNAVNRRALIYYDRQEARGGAIADRAMQARVIQAIGEDLLTRDDVPGAFVWFSRALEITEDLVEHSPDDPDAIFAHAQSEYWIGQVHEKRLEWPQAFRRYSHYAAAADRLIAMAPGNPDYMMEVAWGAQNLATIYLNEGSDRTAAQRLYRKAAIWFDRAAQARPRGTRAPLEEANAYAWLADSYYGALDWQQSLVQRQRQYRIVERLHRADPDNVEIAFRFAAAQNGLGRSLDKVGRHEEAARFLGAALAAAGELTRRDPANAEWLLFRTFIQCAVYNRPQGTAGADRDQLARDIRAATPLLLAQRNGPTERLGQCNASLR